MKIIDIIKNVATLLSKEEEYEYLAKVQTEPSIETLKNVDLMTRLANLVIRELSEGLICMVEQEQVSNKSSVDFSSLTKMPLSVIGVYDENGAELTYSLSQYGVTTSSGCISKIKYSYLPSNYGLEDEIGTFEKPVTANILTYGVLAEYCLTEGRFDEAVMWNNRYSENIDNLCKPKNGMVKSRNFV